MIKLILLALISFNVYGLDSQIRSAVLKCISIYENNIKSCEESKTFKWERKDCDLESVGGFMYSSCVINILKTKKLKHDHSFIKKLITNYNLKKYLQ